MGSLAVIVRPVSESTGRERVNYAGQPSTGGPDA
jgi:hypothetical protein